MTFHQSPADRALSRRKALAAGGVLSVAGISVLAGSASAGLFGGKNKKTKGDPEADAALINTAISLEHEGIAAYQIAAESGLLEPAVLEVGVLFQSHHKAHRDELARIVTTLGGTPVEADSQAAYAEQIEAGNLKNQADILQLAIRLELGAANAYLGVLPGLMDPDYHHLFARLAADEAMHWAALKGAVGEALPQNALSFG